MARSFSHTNPWILSHSAPRKPSPSDSRRCFWRPPLILSAIRCGGTSSLNAPLEPTSSPGTSLAALLQNNPDSFYDAVSSELSRLSDDRDSALARFHLSFGSPHASLHRETNQLEDTLIELETMVKQCTVVRWMILILPINLYPDVLIQRLRKNPSTGNNLAYGRRLSFHYLACYIRKCSSLIAFRYRAFSSMLSTSLTLFLFLAFSDFRRIAKLKEEENQTIIEDIMYMIINQRFSHIRVPLVPSLDKCIYNGRLEILPSKDGELEAIHSLEVLEMIREHLTRVLGWKAGSSVTVNWAPTKIQRLHLSQVYAASVVYGYSLKSISIRHRLEHNASESYLDIIPSQGWAFLLGSGFYGIKSIALGEFSTPRSTTMSQVKHSHGKPSKKLKCYFEGLDPDTLQACAKMRSEVTMDLVEKHCSALFVSEDLRLVDGDKPILTSLASLKRLVLEAVAFGCFLWDAEEYVDRVYKLEK